MRSCGSPPGYFLVIGYDSIEHASLTDVGLRRSHNQDAHAVLLAGDEEQWQKRGHVFLVADGMGAHAVGELASELAAGLIPHTYHKYAEEGIVPALQKAFTEANASIYARGQQNREFKGMGTTSSALLIRADGAWIGHVGDSRIYRIRAGRIEQLSFDHSLAWELARRKGIHPDEVEGIPSNVIVRSMGPEAEVQVDVEGPHPLNLGDVFLVCSDGLSGPLSDYEMGAVASVLPPAEACQFLVALANLRGGPDNITVLIVRVGDGGAEQGTPLLSQISREPWYQRGPFSWPTRALLLGILLAAAAFNMTASKMPGTHVVFGLATFSVLVGVAGLLWQTWREWYDSSHQGSRRRSRIYRQSSCRIEPALVDQLVKVEAALKQLAENKHLETDWPTFQQHHQLAEKSLSQGDLVGAFREYCRAMLPLSDAVHRQHHKAEVFQPLWEKKQSSFRMEDLKGRK